MTRRTRRTIFYTLVALFFIIGSAVVLYAEGWRLDLATFHTEKVGGIFVRSFPDNASITLDGKPVNNQSNFLSRGTLISNLFPRTYSLALTASGYDAWHENADVLPSLVTTMKYAVLVPQAATAVATTSNIKNFFVIGNDFVAQHATGTIVWRNLTIGDGTIVSHSTNLTTMIFKGAAGAYMLYNFTTQKTVNLTAILASKGADSSAIGDILVDPYNDTTVLAVSKTKIWAIDPGAQTATAIGSASSGNAFAPTIASSPSLLDGASHRMLQARPRSPSMTNSPESSSMIRSRCPARRNRSNGSTAIRLAFCKATGPFLFTPSRRGKRAPSRTTSRTSIRPQMAPCSPHSRAEASRSLILRPEIITALICPRWRPSNRSPGIRTERISS